MTLTLPPRYTNVPAFAVFDADLPDPLFRTLTQLHGLAWQDKGQITQPFTLDALAAMRRLRPRQMRDHLTELETRDLIHIERLGGGRMRVQLTQDSTQPDSFAPGELAQAADAASVSIPAPTLPEPSQIQPANPIASQPEPSRTQPANPIAAQPERVLEVRFTPTASQPGRNPKVQSAPTTDRLTPAPADDPEATELAQEIAHIFMQDGDLPAIALAKAEGLIAQYGPERCETQLDYFPARCRRAQASAQGLRNPSGLFIKSVSQNWSPPPSIAVPEKRKTWYSAEEYELLIVH